jgi:hypothetical protein
LEGRDRDRGYQDEESPEPKHSVSKSAKGRGEAQVLTGAQVWSAASNCTLKVSGRGCGSKASRALQRDLWGLKAVTREF